MKYIYAAIAIVFVFSTTVQAGDVFKNMQHNWQKGTKEISRNISHGISQRQERRENFANNITKAWHNAADNRQQRRENRADTINKAYHNTIDNIDKRRHNRADTMNQAVKNVGRHHDGHDSHHDDDYYYDHYYHGNNDHWNNHWYDGTHVVVAINPSPVYYGGYTSDCYWQAGGCYTSTCTDVIVQQGYWTYDAWGNSIYISPHIGRVCR